MAAAAWVYRNGNGRVFTTRPGYAPDSGTFQGTIETGCDGETGKPLVWFSEYNKAGMRPATPLTMREWEEVEAKFTRQ